MRAEFDNTILKPELRIYDGAELKFKKDIDNPKDECIKIIQNSKDLNTFEKIKVARTIDEICNVFPINKIIMED